MLGQYVREPPNGVPVASSSGLAQLVNATVPGQYVGESKGGVSVAGSCAIAQLVYATQFRQQLRQREGR